MREIKFAGEIRDGKLIIYSRDILNREICDWKDQKIIGRLQPMYRKRTNNQNGFYWSNFVPSQIEAFMEFWGDQYRADQVHDWNKANFWGEQKVIEATGELVTSPASSTDQNTVEFEAKIELIRQWFRQNFEWELPYPMTQEELKLKTYGSKEN